MRIPRLGCALFDGPDGILLRGRPLPLLVEVVCGSTFEGSKSNCTDPGLWSSSFLDGSGIGSLLKKSCVLFRCSTISVGEWGKSHQHYHATLVTVGRKILDRWQTDQTATKHSHSAVSYTHLTLPTIYSV